MLEKFIDWLEWLGLFLPEGKNRMTVQDAVKAVGVVVRELEKCYGSNLMDAADMVDDHNADRRQNDPEFFDCGVYFELELSTEKVRDFRLAYDRLKEISP